MLVVRGNRVGVAEDVKDWWDVCWELTRGCTPASTECKNCLAAVMFGRDPGAARFVTTTNPHNASWTGQVTLYPEALDEPRKWPKGRIVFAGPMSDLFYVKVPDDFIERVVETVQAHPQHVFGFLTKRADRMRDFFRNRSVPPNAWLGVSVGAPAFLDRVAALREIQEVSVRWVSAEPLLAPLPLPAGIDWLVAGPELGINARPFQVEWFRSLRDECKVAGVPFFMKHQLDRVEYREYPDG